MLWCFASKFKASGSSLPWSGWLLLSTPTSSSSSHTASASWERCDGLSSQSDITHLTSPPKPYLYDWSTLQLLRVVVHSGTSRQGVLGKIAQRRHGRPALGACVPHSLTARLWRRSRADVHEKAANCDVPHPRPPHAVVSSSCCTGEYARPRPASPWFTK